MDIMVNMVIFQIDDLVDYIFLHLWFRCKKYPQVRGYMVLLGSALYQQNYPFWMEWSRLFIHIPQGYLTGTGADKWPWKIRIKIKWIKIKHVQLNNLQKACLVLYVINHTDGSVQNCSNSIAYALELLQSCTKPSICCFPSQCPS